MLENIALAISTLDSSDHAKVLVTDVLSQGFSPTALVKMRGTLDALRNGNAVKREFGAETRADATALCAEGLETCRRWTRK
jgi:hypothetical protein